MDPGGCRMFRAKKAIIIMASVLFVMKFPCTKDWRARHSEHHEYWDDDITAIRQGKPQAVWRCVLSKQFLPHHHTHRQEFTIPPHENWRGKFNLYELHQKAGRGKSPPPSPPPLSGFALIALTLTTLEQTNAPGPFIMHQNRIQEEDNLSTKDKMAAS